ncbi:hypothetical protein [Niastella yeongjuensis]|nr:hypothetical protein [Niastella yeongjuensis]
MQIRLLLISCCCLIYFGSAAQKMSIEKELYIVDTIEIKDPILIKFKENGHYLNNVLVPKESLDYVRKDDTSCLNFLCSHNGYLFLLAAEFSCLVNNLLYYYPSLEHSRFYNKLQTHLRNAEQDIVLVPVDKNTNKLKEQNGWRYSEIYPRKFLLCLAKGSAINRCQGKYEIRFKNMDNVYFKVLCPVTW